MVALPKRAKHGVHGGRAPATNEVRTAGGARDQPNAGSGKGPPPAGTVGLSAESPSIPFETDGGLLQFSWSLSQKSPL